jgi:hypothetical protein
MAVQATSDGPWIVVLDASAPVLGSPLQGHVRGAMKIMKHLEKNDRTELELELTPLRFLS